MTVKDKIIEVLEKFFQNPMKVDELYYDGKTTYNVCQFLKKYVSYFGKHLTISDRSDENKSKNPDCIYVINWVEHNFLEKIPFTKTYQYSLKKYLKDSRRDGKIPRILELSNIFRISGFSNELQDNILDDISDYFMSDIIHMSVFNIMYSDFLGSIPIYYLGGSGNRGPLDRELFRSIQDLKDYYESHLVSLRTSGYLIYQTYVKL